MEMESSFPLPDIDDFPSAREESTIEYEDFDGTNQVRAHLSITIISCCISFIGNPLVVFCVWRTPLLHDVTWLCQCIVCFSVLLHTIALPFSYLSHTDPMNWPLDGIYSCQAVHFFSDFGNVFMRLSILTACGIRWLSYSSINSICRRRPFLTVTGSLIVTLLVSILSSLPAIRFVFLYQDDYDNQFCLFNDVRSKQYKMWFTYLLIMTLILPLMIMVLSITLLMVRGDRLYAEEYDPRMEFHNIHEAQQYPSADHMQASNTNIDPTMLSSTVLKNPSHKNAACYGNDINNEHQCESTTVKVKPYVIEFEDFRTLTIRDQKKATLMHLFMSVSFAVCLAPISIIWAIYLGSDFNNSSPALFHSYRVSGLVAATFPMHIPIICFLFSRHLRQNVIELCKIRKIFIKITR
ncbi:uncharacterized protein [Antedon mediterranea]|uniref:uncharacterized protein n=1 Tax=Antedon mediterranea TaxID=105859 RepID=UPI003AF95BDC